MYGLLFSELFRGKEQEKYKIYIQLYHRSILQIHRVSMKQLQ